MSYPVDSNGHVSDNQRREVQRRAGPWSAATFELEDIYTIIPGWMPQEVVTRGDVGDELLDPVTWNGWDCPHFEKAAADLIVKQHNEWVQSHASRAGRVYPDDLLARFDTDSDSYHFFMIDGYDPDVRCYFGEWETYTGMAVEVEPGYRHQLYPIGAWSWIWERIEPQS